MIKLIKKLLCRHKFIVTGEYYDNQGNGHMYKKYIHTCKKCGKVKYQ